MATEVGVICYSGNGRIMSREAFESPQHQDNCGGRYCRPIKVIKCDCGSLVYCDSFTNTCDKCEADYNTAGQRLAPRSQWGEETGETAADILQANRVDWDEVGW